MVVATSLHLYFVLFGTLLSHAQHELAAFLVGLGSCLVGVHSLTSHANSGGENFVGRRFSYRCVGHDVRFSTGRLVCTEFNYATVACVALSLVPLATVIILPVNS